MKYLQYPILVLNFCVLASTLTSQTICGWTAPQLDCEDSLMTTGKCDTLFLPELVVVDPSHHLEYVVTKVGQLADDSLGNAIIGSSLSDTIVPPEFGLMTGDTFDVVPISYDIEAIQDFIDGIFNGFLCCEIILIATDFDLCDSLMARGINQGSDIQSLADLQALLEVFGTSGTISLPALLNAVDTINANVTEVPESCRGGVDELCYAAPQDSGFCRYVLVKNSEITVMACDIYLSPGGQLLDSSGTYLDTIAAAPGCDSVITIHLSILESSTSTVDTTACFSFVSPGGKVFDSTGTFMDTIPNAEGCDSIMTINLTVETDSLVCGFPPCADTIDITAAFLANDPHQSTFHATNKITAKGKITSANAEDLTFLAGQVVELLPEFEVELGAQLLIDISPCVLFNPAKEPPPKR